MAQKAVAQDFRGTETRKVHENTLSLCVAKEEQSSCVQHMSKKQYSSTVVWQCPPLHMKRIVWFAWHITKLF